MMNDEEYEYLSCEELPEYIKNRPPLLMIKDAYVKPGKEAYSERTLEADEWFFECHFPGNPMVPGVLQLESMFNTAALPIKILEGNKDKTTNISRVKDVQFLRHILPGEKIRIETRIDRYRRGVASVAGRILVDDTVCCAADFVLVVLDDILEVKKGEQDYGDDE